MTQELAVIAAGALTLLQPYLPTIATKAAEKVGEGIPGSVAKIWQRVREKFSKSPAASESLDDLLKHPNDPDYLATFRVQLRKILETDPDFLHEVAELVKEGKASVSNTTVQEGIGNISVQGSHNTVNQRIGQIAENITNVGYQPKQIPASAVAEFLDLMQSVPSLKVHITANILDHQTHFLAKQLTDLLGKAGWDVSGDSLSMYAPELPKGILFFVPELNLSLDILTKFLRAAGFKPYAFLDPSKPSYTVVVNGVD